jgi:hypothetical protein
MPARLGAVAGIYGCVISGMPNNELGVPEICFCENWLFWKICVILRQ